MYPRIRLVIPSLSLLLLLLVGCGAGGEQYGVGTYWCVASKGRPAGTAETPLPPDGLYEIKSNDDGLLAMTRYSGGEPGARFQAVATALDERAVVTPARGSGDDCSD